MASRRDQLNAYTFARRRTVAAFLQSSPSGSEEGAPRPLRTLAPGLVLAALLVAGSGAWGLIRPGAPQGWDTPGAKVLVGSESTTRYVVLDTPGGRPQLHPVLNLASARLLLDPQEFGVVKIDESVLDDGRIPHGPTLGIPYAPDRLPDAADAGTPKLWSVCEQPGGSAGTAQKAAFVLAARDAPRVDGAGRLHGNQVLYVQGPDGMHYLVDAHGTLFPVGAAERGDGLNVLLRALFGDGARPQRVTADWLRTFNPGRPLDFPAVPGFGDRAGVPGLGAGLDRIGMVLRAAGGAGSQEYVVLRGRVAPVSGLVARLLLSGAGAPAMYPGGVPAPQGVAAQRITPDPTPYLGATGWPRALPRQADAGRTTTVCSVYRGVLDGARPRLSVWAGTRYPAEVADGGTTAYVTPGSGLLYRQVTGGGTSGSVHLVTDTGLRYGVPVNGASSTGAPPPDPAPGAPGSGSAGQAQVRLGYGQVTPVPVPAVWSAFLPAGPTLDTAGAIQQQGS